MSPTRRKACSAPGSARCRRARALPPFRLADRRRRPDRALIRLRDEYGNPEVYVTENGACYDDAVGADGIVHDDDRIAYLREHLAAARAALAAGVKLRGYFVWSLLDNFEWAEGYSRRFGIVRVDFANLRTPKASFAIWPIPSSGAADLLPLVPA